MNFFRNTILFVIGILFLSVSLYAKPVTGVLSLGLTHNTPRGVLLSGFFDSHMSKIISTVNSLEQLDDPALRAQLANETDGSDSYLINFSKRADIPIVIRGSIVDRGEYVIIRIYAFSHDIPYNGSLIADHEVSIPILDDTGSRELSYIMEEHTGRFLSKLLRNYRRIVSFSVVNRSIANNTEVPDSQYTAYTINSRDAGIASFSAKGMVSVTNGTFKHSLREGDYFLLIHYRDEAKFLDDFFYGRKREVVFQRGSIEKTVTAIVATPVLSIISPIGTPISYYLTSDYEGLGLWALNNSPYLYIASYGYFNSPDHLKDNNKNISQFDKSAHYFSYYYFLSAGMAMYADAVGHKANSDASNYFRAMAYTGDPAIGLYLSFLGSGAGHFYKGYRTWGYFYYHTDNLLLLSSLYFLSEPEEYRGSHYISSSNNQAAGFSLLAAAVAVRIIEIFHCSSLKFNINNGSEINNRVETVPTIEPDSSGGMFMGLSFRKPL